MDEQKRSERKCVVCSTAFTPRKIDHTCCSPKCRKEKWNKAHVQKFVSPDGRQVVTVVTK